MLLCAILVSTLCNDANDRLITGRAEPYLLRRYVDYREAVRVTASLV